MRKTIRASDDVYDRLQTRKKEDETISDLLNRLWDETQPDRYEGFGTLEIDENEELEKVIEASRKQTSIGLTKRQQDVLEKLSEVEDSDETA